MSDREREKYERYAKEWAHSFQEWRTMYDAAARRTEEAVAMLRWLVQQRADAGDYQVIVLTNDESRRIDAFLNTFADPSGPDASGDDGKVSTQGAAHEVPRARPGSQSGGGSASTCVRGAPQGESPGYFCHTHQRPIVDCYGSAGPFHDQPEPASCPECGTADGRVWGGSIGGGWLRCEHPFHDEPEAGGHDE